MESEKHVACALEPQRREAQRGMGRKKKCGGEPCKVIGLDVFLKDPVG